MVDCFSTSILASSVPLMMIPSQEDPVKLVLVPPVKVLRNIVPDNQAPLDLSCKTSGHDLLRRSSSSSSASSNDSGFLSSDLAAHESGSDLTSGETGYQGSQDGNEEYCEIDEEPLTDEKRLKRREQNKAAAQAYRQRKKSFSELVESEYDLLLRQNLQLLQRKEKLETQITRMRQLLDHVIQSSKRRQEEEEELLKKNELIKQQQHQQQLQQQLLNKKKREMINNEQNCDGIERDFGVTFSGGDEENYLSDAGHQTTGLGSGRSRQYSWPSDGSTCPTGPVGKNRKKEQNRIASQRFRERRRRALSKSQEEANIYQCSNAQLKKQCDELERKIEILKGYLEKKQILMQGEFQEQQL